MAWPCAATTLNQQEIGIMNLRETELRRIEPLDSSADFEPHATAKISSALTAVLADMFALYLKTKNFHWHISGPHFRDYHLLLDEQSGQILAATDAIAERVRKIGGTTLHSIGHIARLQRIADNDKEFVAAEDMLVELLEDNRQLTSGLRSVHTLCGEYGDVASASLIENWIDEAEHRAWFLFEAAR
jgi:starvation-inducible DNA-binding protein